MVRLSQLLSELEYDFGATDQAELVSGGALDRGRIALDVLDLRAKILNLRGQPGNLAICPLFFQAKGAEPSQTGGR